ncbi:MAG: acyl-CoA mutase large subunit family protein [Odoribacteraceae bacterium]|jgi:methylmalonyl-CoA mutase|nr:acyl-CoA mutase large subunit family protein [Odoribacteraceae bacterium]
MANNVHAKLFSEFPPTPAREWKEKVIADLKGADFDKKLVWRTNEGFNVQPMYRREDLLEVQHLGTFPGEFPYVRGNKKENNDWFVRQDIRVEDAASANRKALEVLNRGADSLGFAISSGADFSKQEMRALLEGICLECIEMNFVVGRGKVRVLQLFREVVDEKGLDPAALRGGINIDPIGKLMLEGKWNNPRPFELVKEAIAGSAAMPDFKVVEVSGYIFNNSGSSVAQELGFSLAAGVEYLDRLTDLGLTVEEIAPRLRFHFATGSKYFMEIAKLRAARLLWARIAKAYGTEDRFCRMNIHAETSEWNKTLYDPNVNMLRTQTEAMSAVLGGVDSFTVHPYDYAYECCPSELGERVARNQQLLLKEESHFGKIVDPAGGSYYIEELTRLIAEAAWKLFLDAQERGGFAKALEEGFVQAAVNATARKRDLDIVNRKENFLGTNQYPNFNEVIDAPPCDCVLEPEDATAPDAVIETLKPYRGTQPFEAARLKTDLRAKAAGRRPVVYMFPMGSLAMRKARAQFACNFFACAGFQVIDNNGFKTVEEGARACRENKADIVVVCSSDEEYETLVPQINAALAGDAIVVVAGNPECRPRLEAEGVTRFIHVRSNLLEELKKYQTELKIS